MYHNSRTANGQADQLMVNPADEMIITDSSD